MFGQSNTVDSLLGAILQQLEGTKPSIRAQCSAVVDCFMQSPGIPASLCIKIGYKRFTLQSSNYLKTLHVLREELQVGHRTPGYIEIHCPDAERVNTPGLKSLIKALSLLLILLIEKQQARLQIKRTRFAIKEILGQIEKEKEEVEDKMHTNIKKLILPALDRLKADNLTTETRKQYLGILESNLKELSSDFVSKAARDNIKLSPRELEIINLITNGLHTKDIAQILQISILTVERHRFNIRKKLGIKQHQVNLQSYLQHY